MDPTDLSSSGPRTEARPSRNGPGTLGERVQSLRLRASEGRPATPRSAWLPWGLTALCVLLTAAFGYRAYRYSRPETFVVDAPASPGNSAPERVAPAATGAVALESKGYVLAAHTIQISPQVGGEVIYLDPEFREGVVFQKGRKIAVVDPVSFEARVRSAAALVRVAEVNLAEVKGGSALKEIEAARSQLDSLDARWRISIIDERNKVNAGVGSTKDEKDKANTQVLADRAARDSQEATLALLQMKLKERIAVAEAQLLKARADLEDAEKQLKNCTILAPTTGFILSKKAELGGYVNPLAFGAAGYLCEMADLGDLEIEIDVQERDVPRVFPSQLCTVMPEAYQRDAGFLKAHPQGYEARVSRLMPTANRSKGAIPVRVTVDIPAGEAGRYLRPDMGVIVSFLNKN